MDTKEILLAEYREVCASHSAITDFRAKLLALLPIASATAFGVLIAADEGPSAQVLIGVGLFGFVVTFGLFLYELRQIDTCRQLRNHASWIEQRLGIEAGQFSGRRRKLSLTQIYRPSQLRTRSRRYREAEKEGRLLKLDHPKAESASDGPKEPSPWSRPFVGAATAGYVVYHTVMLGWLAVAITGLVQAVA